MIFATPLPLQVAFRRYNSLNAKNHSKFNYKSAESTNKRNENLLFSTKSHHFRMESLNTQTSGVLRNSMLRRLFVSTKFHLSISKWGWNKEERKKTKNKIMWKKFPYQQFFFAEKIYIYTNFVLSIFFFAAPTEKTCWNYLNVFMHSFISSYIFYV